MIMTMIRGKWRGWQKLLGGSRKMVIGKMKGSWAGKLTGGKVKMLWAGQWMLGDKRMSEAESLVKIVNE